MQDESQLEAEKEYAMVEPKQNEAFSAYFCRFCEIRRKVGIARNLSTNEALPEQSSVSKLVQSLEQSKIVKFMGLGYSLREELTQRARLDKTFVPTLEDVKVIGESQFKKKSASLQEAGGSNGLSDAGGKGGKSAQRAAKKDFKQRGQKVRVASDDDPSAVAHMAHGRKPICYRCGTDGHHRSECTEVNPPLRQTFRKSSNSRSPSRKRSTNTQKGEEVSNSAMIQMMQEQMTRSNDMMQLLLQQQSGTRTAAAAREDPSPGVFA